MAALDLEIALDSLDYSVPPSRNSISVGAWGGDQLKPSRMAIAAAAILACLSAPVFAESLDDAMASAYLDNMQLNAARASLRATDESVPLAVTAFRPTINGAGSATWSW